MQLPNEAPATVFDAFAHAAARYGEKPFLAVLPETAQAYGIAAGEISYGEAFARINALTEAYRARGYGAGHRVGVLMENRPGFFLHWFALNALGVSLVPINPDMRAAELEYLIGHSEIVAAVVIPQRRADVAAATKAIGRDIPVVGPDDEPAAIRASAPKRGAPDRDSECALLYTSGTTGRPKGVPLTHANLLASVRGVMQAWRWSAEDVLVHALPLSHQHGLSGVNATLLAGSRAALLSSFEPGDLCATIARERATVLFAVPAMYERLVTWQGIGAADLGSLRLAVSGSAPLSPSLFERVGAAFGQPPLERYGSTETGLSVSNPYDGPRKPGKVGRPLPGIELDIVDDEVVLRGPQVFAGYENRPDETAEAFLDGGWFRTGDLGRVDPEDGYLEITGRRKELIVTGGLNVSPREVELVLEDHPEVARVAVVGLPSEEWGEEVVAVVVPAAGTTPGGEALIAHARERLSAYKCPKRVMLVDELPASAMGKVQREEIVELIEREEGAWTSA
jgi:malonyl-CoA/methylmalonyl-CoA synthetase